MNIKRIVIHILVIVTAFTAFILWYEKNVKDESLTAVLLYKMNWQSNTPATNPTYKIYLITNEKQPQFWHYVNQGVSDMADLLGLTYTWEAPVSQEIELQIDIVNDAVKNGADAIIISPLDATRLAVPIKQAKEKGIKIIYINSFTDESENNNIGYQ
jgi:ABC-type sugar transport system substrate-binding protein